MQQPTLWYTDCSFITLLLNNIIDIIFIIKPNPLTQAPL